MDAVEDIKSRLSIEDVVADYMELKRAGRNLKGLSPFSNEKTASFMVSPEKQIWHDFSSGKGGDMFTIVMELEGVDFKGALEILAKKAGVDLGQYQQGDSGRSKQKTRVLEALESATHFYQVQFSKHKTALEYVLGKREFTKQTALEWRVGYSPDQNRALIDYLRSKKFTDQEIKSAGLATIRQGGLSDMFRGRVMIPLQDARGAVIGFTARLLKDDSNAPKYINTPQTIVYDKSRHVFGLHLAKDAIRKMKFVVAVEGNLDVIASHQAGIHNVVASAGTAITDQHLKEMLRFTDDIRLAFDQDQAGLNAMERIIPIASKMGVSLSIITVPEGKDPDELIKKNPKTWQEAIVNYDYAVDWLIKQYEQKVDTNSGAGKRVLTDTVLPIVAELSDSVERDHYIGVLAEKINISKDALESKLKNTTVKQLIPSRKNKLSQVSKITKQQADAVKTQNQLLALGLMKKELRHYIDPIRVEMLVDDDAKKMLRILQQNPNFKLSDNSLPLKQLKEVENYCKILLLLYEELYAALEILELQYEAARLQVRVIEQYVKSKKTELVERLRNADESTTETLLQEAKKLDVLLKTAKETTRGKR